jgi:hypothetical protein
MGRSQDAPTPQRAAAAAKTMQKHRAFQAIADLFNRFSVSSATRSYYHTRLLGTIAPVLWVSADHIVCIQAFHDQSLRGLGFHGQIPLLIPAAPFN